MVNEKCGEKCRVKTRKKLRLENEEIALPVISVLQALICYKYFLLSTTLRIF